MSTATGTIAVTGEDLFFSQKRINVYHPPLYFNEVEVVRVNDHKHLGLILDSKLTFEKHINSKIVVARKLIGILKYLSSYIPLKSLTQIYKSFIHPHFDYGDVIYHIPPLTNAYDSSINLNYLMDSIEKIQYQAALVVTGAWQGSSRNKLYDE